jgi:transposase
MSAVEIVSRIERRRRWSAAEKAALLAEVEAEGGRVKLVARRHRVSESLLYNWRSARRAALAACGAGPSGFVQLGTLGGGVSDQLAGSAAGPGLMEIALPGGVRVRVDGFVSEAALCVVLRALRGAP